MRSDRTNFPAKHLFTRVRPSSVLLFFLPGDVLFCGSFSSLDPGMRMQELSSQLASGGHVSEKQTFTILCRGDLRVVCYHSINEHILTDETITLIIFLLMR